jgi:hypothetical protein
MCPIWSARSSKDAATCRTSHPHLGSPRCVVTVEVAAPPPPERNQGGESDRLARRGFWFTGAFSFALSPAVRALCRVPAPLHSKTAAQKMKRPSEFAGVSRGDYTNLDRSYLRVFGGLGGRPHARLT